MKKLNLFLFSSFLIIGIAGCSDDEVSTSPVNDEPAVEKEDAPSEEATKEISNSDTLNFTDFELDVDYAKNIEYEADYELDNGDIEAEIEDDFNDLKLKGDEAFDKLEPMLQKLNITQETTKEEVIQDTLNVFDLPSDYTKFELEITFDDGTEIEFEDRNRVGN